MPRGKSPAKEEAKTDKSPKKAKTAAVAEDAVPAAADFDVFVTSNKTCQAFKKRADELVALVKEEKPDAKIYVNTEKKLGSNPDKGRFAVQVRGEYVVDCGVMPRPFQKMKALSIPDVAKQVLDKL